MKPLLFSILPRPAHPTRDGLAIRNFHLLRALTQSFRVRVFALKAPHLPEGEYPSGVEVEEFRQGSRTSRRALAAAESLVSGEAYPQLLYRSRELARSLAASPERPAWTVAHSYHVALLARIAGVPTWIDFHNLDSQIWERVARTESSSRRRWFAAIQAPRVKAFEESLTSWAQGLSCVSEHDARRLRAFSPRVPPLVVPNGVDLSRYLFRSEPPAAKSVFFVGDLSWPPNADAVRWLAREIWPRIRQEHPEATAEILGREPPTDLAQASDSSFRFLGEGADTRPHWAKTAVAVVPLRAAGGTRLKILEAAACGVPVVSTSIGAEGLELEAGREILLADDAESFAAAVSQLLGDAGQRAEIARAARSRVERLYDWVPIGRRLAAEILSRRAA